MANDQPLWWNRVWFDSCQCCHLRSCVGTWECLQINWVPGSLARANGAALGKSASTISLQLVGSPDREIVGNCFDYVWAVKQVPHRFILSVPISMNETWLQGPSRAIPGHPGPPGHPLSQKNVFCFWFDVKQYLRKRCGRWSRRDWPSVMAGKNEQTSRHHNSSNCIALMESG